MRWCDLELKAQPSRLRVRRAIVKGIAGAPKSRHGYRTIPLSDDLADQLRQLRLPGSADDASVFASPRGARLDPDNFRHRVLRPAAQRAGVPWVGFHTLRHTCAALLVDAGASTLQLQRWMGHHSAAYTLDTYGHLIDGDLGPALDLDGVLGSAGSRLRDGVEPVAQDSASGPSGSS